MKAIHFAFVWVFITASISAQEFTFRGMPFGSSHEHVISVLGEPDERLTDERRMLGDTSFIYYELEVAGQIATVEIEFINNEMIGGAYDFQIQRHYLDVTRTVQNPQPFARVYNQLVETLERLYGDSDSHESVSEGPYSTLFAKSMESETYMTQWHITQNGQYREMIVLTLSFRSEWRLDLGYLRLDESYFEAAQAAAAEGL